ncbi:hypothetical protein VTJ49DRAFT_2053 [Mycothermus thermophilus]|uniref:Rhodanese domain-containing protein n=1 Tax=Humicola insolens TaxID=85995 RepID=A0ABR3VBQ1_HUMIN
MAVEHIYPSPDFNREHKHRHNHSHTQHDHHHGPHEHCSRMTLREDGTPWYTAFPEPRSVAPRLDPEDVFRMLQAQARETTPLGSESGSDSGSTSSRDTSVSGVQGEVLIVDARRSDCTGGTIRGAINLPAHSFYPTRGVLYDLCMRAGVKMVVFYCASSHGRGPRCAAWLQDYVGEVGGDLQCRVLSGGIRGWVQAYGGDMIDGFDEKEWQSKYR